MKKTNAAGDAVYSRVIEEITFRAGLLALHAAIASAGTELNNPVKNFGASPNCDDPMHTLAERAPRTSEGTEPSKVRDNSTKLDPRGF